MRTGVSYHDEIIVYCGIRKNMSNLWKRDIYRAIFITVVVSVAAIAINSVRDPVLAFAAKKGWITPGTQDRVRAVNIIDDWSHEGKFGFSHLPYRRDDPHTGENDSIIDTSQTQTVIYKIEVEDAKRLFDESECLFLDARTVEEYVNDGHIPGAINWPAANYDQFRRRLIDTIDFNQCLVVYCSNPSCTDSSFLASSLRNEGFTEIYWFEAGMEDWLWMGYPVVFSSEP
ncbi:MAG TPA: rhodanese-like domain-containing protein [Firmicutes bacterium]|nr:rhodanese-like domain-containing protein [Bacillota bacterium]